MAYRLPEPYSEDNPEPIGMPPLDIPRGFPAPGTVTTAPTFEIPGAIRPLSRSGSGSFGIYGAGKPDTKIELTFELHNPTEEEFKVCQNIIEHMQPERVEDMQETLLEYLLLKRSRVCVKTHFTENSAGFGTMPKTIAINFKLT